LIKDSSRVWLCSADEYLVNFWKIRKKSLICSDWEWNSEKDELCFCVSAEDDLKSALRALSWLL
jgi:hypothetical protein